MKKECFSLLYLSPSDSSVLFFINCILSFLLFICDWYFMNVTVWWLWFFNGVLGLVDPQFSTGRLGVPPTTKHWSVAALLGQQLSPLLFLQEASFRLLPAASCHHQKMKNKTKHVVGDNHLWTDSKQIFLAWVQKIIATHISIKIQIGRMSIPN